MAEKLTWDIEAKDRASSALRSIKKASDEMRESMESVATEGNRAMGGATAAMDGASSSAQGMRGAAGSAFEAFKSGSPHVIALNQALELGQKAMAAFGAVASEVSRLMGDGISMYREQRKTLLDLERAFRTAGLGGGALRRQMEELQVVSNSLAAETIYGNDQIEDAIAAYQRLVPEILSVQEAREDLNTILGIAYVHDMDASKAAEVFARAAEGNVRGLERLTSMTREQVQQLATVPDASERARIATQALRDAYEDAAFEADGIAVAMNRIGNVRDTILKTFGEAVLESQAMSEAFDEAATALEKVMDLFVENQDLISEWAEDIGITLLAALRESTEALSTIKSGLDVALPPMRALREETEIFGKYAIGAANGVGQLSKVVLAGIPGLQALTPAVDMATQALTRIMRRADQIKKEKVLHVDDDALSTWELLKGMAEDAKSEIVGMWEGLKSDIDAALSEQAADDMARRISELRLEAMQESDDLTRARLDRERALLGVQQQGLEGWEREHRLQEISITYEQERARIVEAQRADREREREAAEREAEAAAKRASREAQELAATLADEARRNDLAALRLQLLVATDELQEAELERQIALREIRDQELTALEREYEERRIQAEFEAAQEAYLQAQREELERQREEAHQRALERHREEFSAAQASIRGVARELGRLYDNPLTIIGANALQAAAMFRELEEAGAGAAEQIGAAMGAGASAVTGAAKAMGASTQQLAGIQAAFEAAQAVAAGAAGNIPGAVAHGVASAMFAAVAAGAGSSSTAANSTSSTGTPTRGGTGATQPPEEHREMLKQAHLEALREHDRGGHQVVYNIYQNNSTFFERDTASQRRTERTLREAGALRYSTSTLRG